MSDNGVGSGSISWQGYEMITGRITSQNLGSYIFSLLLIKISCISDIIVSVPRFNNYRGRVSYIKSLLYIAS